MTRPTLNPGQWQRVGPFSMKVKCYECTRESPELVWPEAGAAHVPEVLRKFSWSARMNRNNRPKWHCPNCKNKPPRY